MGKAPAGKAPSKTTTAAPPPPPAGEAGADLPDPLTESNAGAAPSADDLLAQMAGTEIDRLLAEADVERPSADGAAGGAATITSGAAGGATEVDEDAARQLDELFEQIGKSPADGAAEERRPTADSAAEVAAELDDPLRASKLGDLFPKAGVAATAPVADAQGLDVDEQTGPDERRGLAEAEAEPEVAAVAPEEPPATPGDVVVPAVDASAAAAALSSISAEAAPVDVTGEGGAQGARAGGDGEAPLPFYLRPLAWLSAPLDGLPDAFREALGKVAIMTLVNALAVLLYVLIFRRG